MQTGHTEISNNIVLLTQEANTCKSDTGEGKAISRVNVNSINIALSLLYNSQVFVYFFVCQTQAYKIVWKILNTTSSSYP